MGVLPVDDSRPAKLSGEGYLHILPGKGTLGAAVTLTPTAGDEKRLVSLIINAPLADTDATVKLYIDAVGAPGLKFDGYMMNRDADGRIKFPEGIICATDWRVVVSGATNDVFVLAEYR